MEVKKISEGHFDADGRFTVKKKFGSIAVSELEAFAEETKDFFLKFELTETESYDDSDDDRWSCGTDTSHRTVYAELDPIKDSEALLSVDGRIVGVVFRVTPKSSHDPEEQRAFFFDGSVAQGATLGYSASHSSKYTSVNRITLVRRGEDGAPAKGESIRFKQHEMYPSF